MLRSFRKHELRAEIDDLFVDNLLGRIFLRHKAEHLLPICLFMMRVHAASSYKIFLLFCILTLNRIDFK